MILLDRSVRLLLRSPLLIKGLPLERHSEAMAVFSTATIRLLHLWRSLNGPSQSSSPAMQQRFEATRSALITHLLASASPEAAALLALAEAGGSSMAVGAARALASGPSSLRSSAVLNADGSRSLSAAPFLPSPLHWRYELTAGAILAILHAPSALAPSRFSIDAARLELAPALPSVGAAPLAPEALWLWVLSNSLSENTFLRLQAISNLLLLLHQRASARGNAALPPLRAVTALLCSPAFVSQFVAALASNHKDAPAPDGSTSKSSGDVGMRELALPLESVRAFVEYSRHSLRGGAVSRLDHMTLFQLLALELPASVPTFLVALRSLGGNSLRLPTTASASDNNNNNISVDDSGTSADVSSSAQQELATLRNRQATLAEAFGGFIRALSFLKARFSSGPLAAAAQCYEVRFSSSDAVVASLRASCCTTPAAAAEVWPGTLPAHVDAAMCDVIAACAPVLDTTSLDWSSDWSNSLRFAIRQRHPAEVAPLVRYVFASAFVALNTASSLDVPASVLEATLDGLEGLLATVAGTAAVPLQAVVTSASDAPVSLATPPLSRGGASSYAAQARWLRLVQAFTVEGFAYADGHGISGTLPGVTCDDEAAGELGSSSSPGTASPPPALSTRAAVASLTRALLPTLLRSCGHPYKATREEVVRTLIASFECGWAPVSVAAGEGALPAPPVGMPVAALPGQVAWEEWASPSLAALLHLGVLAVRVASPAVDAGASPESSWAKHCIDAVLHFSYFALGADAPVSAAVSLPLLPLLLRCVAHPDKELSRLASAVAGGVAHSLTLWRAAVQDERVDAAMYLRVDALLAKSLGGSAAGCAIAPACATGMDVAVKILSAFLSPSTSVGTTVSGTVGAGGGETCDLGTILNNFVLSSSSEADGGGGANAWLVRRAALSFITPLRAHHFIGFAPQLRSGGSLGALVEGSLCDSQVEIQESAGEALIGVAMTLSHAAQALAAGRYLGLASTRLPKRVEAPVPDAPSAVHAAHRAYRTAYARALCLRHGGVQGVGALVRAHPFDVPPFLPSVLAALSHHASDPNPVGATVKKAIAEFRRTHHDAWDSHRQAFTEEQLADVLAVGAAATYFA